MRIFKVYLNDKKITCGYSSSKALSGIPCIDRLALVALLSLAALLLLRFLGPHVLVVVGQSLGQTE